MADTETRTWLLDVGSTTPSAPSTAGTWTSVSNATDNGNGTWTSTTFTDNGNGTWTGTP